MNLMTDCKKKHSYTKMVMKIGFEIHQQLNTGKLFCRCPSELRKDEPDFKIKRKLYAVRGETSEFDKAVNYEASKEKDFVYEGYNDTTCLVELDEQPPLEINQDALNEVLKIALLLNCKIFPVTQIMRKTVIDGSNVSGFQRTILIAKDGFVETKYGKVKIDSICLEEDAARIIKKENNVSVYRLDRLGIPLVEIATSPSMNNPEQAKEVALHIGKILRLCNVKRGIGTIRQDVNFNIENYPRVEIKGVQEPTLIVKTINFEAERQKNELNLKKEVEAHVRKAEADGTTSYLRPMPGKARMYPETDLPLLKIDKSLIEKINKNLPKIIEPEEISKKYSLSKDLAKALIDSGNLKILEKLKMENVKPAFIAENLIKYDINEEDFIKVFEKLDKGEISKNHVVEIFEKLSKGEKLDLDEYKTFDDKEIEKIIKKLIEENKDIPFNALMGMIMKELKGKADGKTVMDTLKKLIK